MAQQQNSASSRVATSSGEHAPPPPSVGMLAHDLNNLLATIHLASEMLANAPGLDDRARRQAQAIQSSSLRGRDLVQRLRQIARPTPAHPLRFSMHAEIQDVVRLFTAAHHDRPVRWNAHAANDNVKGFPELAQSAVMNLLLNAHASASAGSPIILQSSAVSLNAAGAVAAHTHPPITAGSYWVLGINDSGCGMAPEVLARCLEPHFSTKGDHGTGLGLPSVLACMQEHHGGMTIASQLGQGTCVTLWFPLTRSS